MKYPKARWLQFVGIVAFNMVATTMVSRQAVVLISMEEEIDDTTPSIQDASTTSGTSSSAMIDDIVHKWNISTGSKTRQLLERIWNRDNSYNPETDLIVFHHPMKSGGTSFSQVLRDAMGGVVLGSEASGFFNYNRFRSEYETQVPPGDGHAIAKERYWSKQRVLYSHSHYRSYKRQIHRKEEKLLAFLHDNEETSVANIKRIRHMTMVRDPWNYVASNFAEWFCELKKWKGEAEAMNMAPSSPNAVCEYSLDDFTKARIHYTEKSCANVTTKSQLKELRRKRDKERCLSYLEGEKDPSPWCASIPAFLSSEKFQKFFNDMFSDYTISNDPNATMDDYVDGALEYLGGLDTSIENGAMMWFGITERMKESMCLFHYQTGLPLIETPTTRFKTCRPTSFWSDEDQQRYRSNQTLDHAVYYAANAILDLELIKMRQDLWSRVLQNRTTIEDMTFSSPECMGARPTQLY